MSPAQLGYSEVEPIILDELHIALGGGPDGYRAQFRNISARGVSALRVTGLRTRLSEDDVQLQLALSIPKIRAAAQYRSSGTLILVQASGAGDYWGVYGKSVRKYCLLTVRSAQRLRYSADDFVGRVKCHLDKRVLIVVTFTIRTNVYL